VRLLRALRREPLDRPPLWLMRQAGRYLPEYRRLRALHSFEETVRTPALATEITLQPLRRFPLDAAIVFADIMTPLAAMGVEIEFAPGPRLAALSEIEVASLGELDLSRVGFVAETIARVRASIDPEVAVIGFAGGPVTLLAYLLEGGSSNHYGRLRHALHGDAAEEALVVLAEAMRSYLAMQIEAGADVVQLFDSWAGLVDAESYERLVAPAAHRSLRGLGAPTIYFAPASAHLLERLHLVGATGYGVDWRLPLGEAWRRVGDHHPLQGNLDPAVLLGNSERVRSGALRVLMEAAGRPGHIFNLGHGLLPTTPVASVEALAEAVLGFPAMATPSTR
jgi:uroporphyrinogen decarboxylase